MGSTLKEELHVYENRTIVNIVKQLREEGFRCGGTTQLKDRVSSGNQEARGRRVFWAKGQYVQRPCGVGDGDDAGSLQAGPWSWNPPLFLLSPASLGFYVPVIWAFPSRKGLLPRGWEAICFQAGGREETQQECFCSPCQKYIDLRHLSKTSLWTGISGGELRKPGSPPPPPPPDRESGGLSTEIRREETLRWWFSLIFCFLKFFLTLVAKGGINPNLQIMKHYYHCSGQGFSCYDLCRCVYVYSVMMCIYVDTYMHMYVYICIYMYLSPFLHPRQNMYSFQPIQIIYINWICPRSRKSQKLQKKNIIQYIQK